jgi:hypothetical protein
VSHYHRPTDRRSTNRHTHTQSKAEQSTRSWGSEKKKEREYMKEKCNTQYDDDADCGGGGDDVDDHDGI